MNSLPTADSRRSGSTTLRRLPLLLLAGAALVLGADAGLELLGVPFVRLSPRLPEAHGFLLVLGFVGALVALERAVALRRRAGFAAPLLLGTGALLLVTPAPPAVGRALLVAGGSALGLVYVALWQRTRDESVVVQALGAVLATGAAVLWLGGVPVPRLLPWLAGFVVLTIAGERLELARIDLDGTSTVLVGCSTGLVLAGVASLLWPAAGFPLLGLVLLALVGWLASHDAARRTIRSTGLPRFVAANLFAGYAWLAVTGGIWVVGGPVLEGPAYDAAVHAAFLGFTMAMIMAHAPVILPAVLRVRLPYHPAMYLPAGLLHVSLLVRTVLGDGHDLASAREAGGVGNALSLLLFVATLLWTVLHTSRDTNHPTAQGVVPAPDRTGSAAPPPSEPAPTTPASDHDALAEALR